MAYDHDSAEDGVEEFDPIEQIEPSEERTNEYREAAIRYIAHMHATLNFIIEAKTESERSVRIWVVLSSLDHPACDGRPDIELAATCGTTRANFSKHKLTYERQNSLPPTFSQKSVAARGSYREARTNQLS